MNTAATGPGLPRIRVEFYGIPRLRAGVPETEVGATTVGGALRSVLAEHPALAGGILSEVGALPGFRLSLNGNRFVDDPCTPLQEGDALLVFSVDAGG